MSLPRELLDDLLGRYMDGSLSADEQRQAEHILESDQEARRVLAAFERQGASLRALRDATPSLGSDFASRVVQRAIAQAEREGIAENHPLRRAGREDDAAASPGRRRRIYATLLVLAATMLVGMLSLRAFLSPDTEIAADSEIAGNAKIASGTAPAVVSGEAHSLLDLKPSADMAGAERSRAEEKVAAAPAGEQLPSDSVAAAGVESAAEVLPRMEDARPGMERRQPAAGDVATVGSAELESAALESAATDALAFLMVYEIEITQRGREGNVVGRLFRQAGIRTSERREVDETLVGHLQASHLIGADESSSDASENRVGVLFLEGSALKLDRLILDFYAAEDEVRRVGIHMVTDAPVKKALEKLRTTDQRAESAASGAGGELSAVQLVMTGPAREGQESFTSGSLPFRELQRGAAGDSPSWREETGQLGEDMTSQVIILLRQVP